MEAKDGSHPESYCDFGRCDVSMRPNQVVVESALHEIPMTSLLNWDNQVRNDQDFVRYNYGKA